MDPALEELVPRRARYRCEYCLLPQAVVTTPFQFDHVFAQSHGGLTTADNLAFACFHCNNFKGTSLAGLDPDTNQVIRLFHPRRDIYENHFRWQGENIIGLTPEGRVTVRTLRLNHPLRLAVRRSLLQEGVRFA